jgi:shikimate kinase
MSNIVLIGMPGCGKSTVGVILAKTLGIGFVDTDLIIQQREKRLLQDIIDTDGIQKFLDCESEAVKSLDCDNCVVATGGSVVFREDCMNHLKENGKIFFLNVSLPEIKSRLDNINTRGVAADKSQTIDDIFNQRYPLYEKYADYILELKNSNIEETVEKICDLIK